MVIIVNTLSGSAGLKAKKQDLNFFILRRAADTLLENTKYEYRNTKQIRILEIQKPQTKIETASRSVCKPF